jgi:multiple sugar transport system permease protein
MAEQLATGARGTARAPRRRWSQRRQEELTAYLFLSPWILGFLVFTVGAMVFSFGLSLFESDLLTEPTFVGAQNYVDLARDPLFIQSLKVTFWYTALTVPLGTVLALGLALMLNQKLVGVGLWRTIYFLPWVVAGVPVALIWNWMLNPQIGLVNEALKLVGITGPRWFASEQWAIPGLVIIALWEAGRNLLLYLSGLQSIPSEIQEAARIDGAGPVRTFFAVTLPLLTPTVFFNLIINIISSFQVFSNVYVLTQGGPNNATLTLVVYLYRQSFQLFQFGYASAIAWVVFAIILVFTLVLIRSSNFWVYYEAGGRK